MLITFIGESDCEAALFRDVSTNAGLFGFLGGNKAGKGKSAELVEELLTAVGSSQDEEISNLVMLLLLIALC